MKAKQKLSLAVAAALSGGLSSAALAATAYTDNFDRLTLNGGTYTYTTVTTAGDGGALTDGSRANTLANTLSLTNDASATAQASGIVYSSTPTSAYTSFNQSLSANTGQLLTWTLNMQQIRSTPSGMGAGNYGSAYVLGATNSSFDSAGGGYALIIGNTGATDPVRLYRYDNGLAAVALSGNTSTAAGAPIISSAATANANYQSIKVTYNAVTGQWSLYTRDDGASTFADPTVNTGYSFAGNSNDATYTSTALTHSGAYWAYANGANQTAKFDNFLLDIDTAPVTTPRNLLWDADATGAATDGSGTWTTANTWIDQADSSHATWDSARPDNATIGAGSGAGSATIDLGAAAQAAGMATFASNSPNYTLSNGTLTVVGYDHDANPANTLRGMVLDQSATFASNAALNWLNTATMLVNGSGTTLTMNGALQGSGEIVKFGDGTVLLNAVSPGRSGTFTINNGTVRVTSTSGGVSGFGSGTIDVNAGATVHLDGSSSALLFQTGSGALFLGDDSTLKASGQVTWQKNYPHFTNGSLANPGDVTIHADSGAFLNIIAQVRNFLVSTTNPSYTTIHLDGPGTVKLNSGGTADPIIYAGSWDVSDGKLVLGKQTGGGAEALNNLGFKAGNALDANTVTVRGTGTLIGTENVPNTVAPSFYRANVVLSGGGLASGDGVDAEFGGTFTTTPANTSTIYTYDPLNPGTARSVNLVAGSGTILNSQGDTNWGGTLIIDPGATTGGAFNISRNGGTVNVTPGAAIQVNSNATLNLGYNHASGDGSLDALSDGVDHVSVLNNGTFTVANGTKNVADLGGAGTTTVDGSANLIANHVRQGSLAVNGNVQIRNQGPDGPASGVSKVGSLTLAGGSKFDVTNNKLIVSSPIGSHNGTNYTGVTGLVEQGRNGGLWNGAGITTSMPDATSGSNYTSLAAASAADVLGIGPSATATWGGQTVSGSDSLVMYTYGGDANLSGFVDIDDYGQIDFNASTGGVLTGYFNGDFDYNGIQDIDDYGIIDFVINIQGAPFSTAGGVSISAVPEPASIGLLGVAATGLLRRRRRSN